MMNNEPAYLETFLTKLAFRFYGKPVYKTFADCIPIKGGEQVLDFGCGMGTVAYYVAKRLLHGHLTCLDISGCWLNACRNTLKDFNNTTYMHAAFPMLPENRYDVVYCHFVLHDLSQINLETVMPALVKSIKPGGVFIFREPLKEAEKLRIVKSLAEKSGLHLKDSRITDIPLMGNALESIYEKETECFGIKMEVKL